MSKKIWGVVHFRIFALGHRESRYKLGTNSRINSSRSPKYYWEMFKKQMHQQV